MMKKGFSLTELLTTVVILAVLAAIALPKFSKSGEKAKANQTIAFLRVLNAAEKMYFAKNGKYWPNAADQCGGNSTTCTDPALIAQNLGATVSTADYSVSLVTDATASTFDATFTKGAATLAIDETGSFAASTSCYKPAS